MFDKDMELPLNKNRDSPNSKNASLCGHQGETEWGRASPPVGPGR